MLAEARKVGSGGRGYGRELVAISIRILLVALCVSQLCGIATALRSDRRPRAVLISLASNSELTPMVQTITALEERFNRDYGYDWAIFSSEELDRPFKEAAGNATNSTITFNVIPKKHWSIPDWIDHRRHECPGATA